MSSCPAVSLVVGPVVFLHVSWGSQHLRRTLAHTKFRIGWALEAILAWLWVRDTIDAARTYLGRGGGVLFAHLWETAEI